MLTVHAKGAQGPRDFVHFPPPQSLHIDPRFA